MRAIRTYELKEGYNKVKMENVANVISAGAVGEKIVVCVETDITEIEETERVFLVIKHETEIDENAALNWIGVAVMPNGDAFYIAEIL